MKSTTNDFVVPTTANDAHRGEGKPVILIHGLAASLHDWDDLIPDLARNGYAAFALDLLGHGDSPKPNSRAYHMDWVFEHFVHWMTSLRLTEPAILIGHSLGGYIALEYARRFPAWTRSLVLVNPFYSLSQLPFLLRRTYRHPSLSSMISLQLPEWIFRLIIDATSISMGHSTGAVHALPGHVRAQTALDYTRTASGVYNIPNTMGDLTEHLPSISLPALVVWGSRDQTLSPSSFPRLVNAMPRAEGKSIHTGHVPHQSSAEEFNARVLEFLSGVE